MNEGIVAYLADKFRSAIKSAEGVSPSFEVSQEEINAALSKAVREIEESNIPRVLSGIEKVTSQHPNMDD